MQPTVWVIFVHAALTIFTHQYTHTCVNCVVVIVRNIFIWRSDAIDFFRVFRIFPCIFLRILYQNYKDQTLIEFLIQIWPGLVQKRVRHKHNKFAQFCVCWNIFTSWVYIMQCPWRHPLHDYQLMIATVFCVPNLAKWSKAWLVKLRQKILHNWFLKCIYSHLIYPYASYHGCVVLHRKQSLSSVDNRAKGAARGIAWCKNIPANAKLRKLVMLISHSFLYQIRSNLYQKFN